MTLDPIAISLFGIFDIRWYSLAYIAGFIFAYYLITHHSKDFGIKKDKAEDIFFYTMILAVLGGRLFYCFVYNPTYYFANPLEILAVWKGGMSMHGGIAGTLLSLFIFSKKEQIPFLKLTDLFALPAGLAFAFGRLANFINQELVGIVTNSSLGIIFPLYDDEKRWPVVLFLGAKNLIMFNILYALHLFTKLKTGVLTALALMLYNYPRFFIDFLRVPTVDLGLISLGQVLSLLYGTLGLILLLFLFRKQVTSNVKNSKTYNPNRVKQRSKG